jgi:hypothetical protein
MIPVFNRLPVVIITGLVIIGGKTGLVIITGLVIKPGW